MNSINIGIIFDRSGSVENEKIALENSFNLFIESFKRKYEENIILRLVFITLGKNDILLQKEKLKNIDLEKIELEDESIKKALEIIEENFKNKEGRKKILLFSDGYFNDEDNSFLNKKKGNTEEIEKKSVGIGEGYRKNTLEKFSTNGIVFEYQDIYDLL